MRLDDTRYTLDASDLGDAWSACGFPVGGSVRCHVASLGAEAKGALMRAPRGTARHPAEARRAAELARWVGVPWAIVTDGETWRLLDATALDAVGFPPVVAEIDLAAETKALEDAGRRFVSDDALLVGFSDVTRARLAPHLLAAWTPVIGLDSSYFVRSQFGGAPWRPHGDAAAHCGCCGAPTKLFLQLDLSTLPKDAPLAGPTRLLQFFHCTSFCERKRPNSGVQDEATPWRIRTIDSTERGDVEPQSGDLARKAIVGWRRFVEFPDIKDLEAIGFDVEDDDEGELLVDTEIPLHETKLGGWPGWMQGREWIDCPDCGSQMRQVFQFESEEHINWTFGPHGGGGRGHVLCCPNHPERFGFSWAYML